MGVMFSPQLPPRNAESRDGDGRLHLPPAEAQALLLECFNLYEDRLVEMAKASLELAHDLFETRSHIPDGEIHAFLNKREEWLERFPKTIRGLFERRLAGQRRKGRRPDADASLATLRVLTAFDHEKQAALAAATAFLAGFTKRERLALDLRMEELLDDDDPGPSDNPFSVDYIVDALGATSRAVYPNPRVWRPLLERLLADVRPVINKLYLALNRLLADHGVLPEIKAALRARSDLRPQDDRDLFGTFAHMLGHDELGIANVVVPEMPAEAGARPSLIFADAPVPEPAPLGWEDGPPLMDSQAIQASLAALAENNAKLLALRAETSATQDFPSLDPLLALGTSTPLFATLAHWQKLDLPAAIAEAAPAAAGESAAGQIVPLNLIPHIRTAIAAQITNPTDVITMDVISLLFDYIFRDASIAESTRPHFGRLQVPIVKAALLDRTFFSDRNHIVRLFLDNLADAAVGTSHHEDYRNSFVDLAQEIIDDICLNYEIDVEVFRKANARLLEFVALERSKTATAVSADVAAARTAEADESDRSAVLLQVRDRLAGLTIPFDVRSFVETVWVDYLTELREQHGEDSETLNAALATLDDMLWSIVVKERAGQRVRLAKMVPTLIAGLRKGCIARKVPVERTKVFFDALYQLHMAAIKPLPSSVAESAAAAPAPAFNVHDYVSEMVVGTWLTFTSDDEVADARLTHISPLRTKYIFTGRYHSSVRVLTPEELAYQLGSGKARLLIEPVPLWDRAVSSALDSLAASRPQTVKPRVDPTRLPA
jgi:hypothetical protein